MKIQVLGSGCQTCKDLFELTKKAVQETGLKDDVEYVTDVTKIIEMGVMTSPLIAIDGKPVLLGSTSDIDRIKDLLLKKSEASDVVIEECSGNCDCDCKKPETPCTCGGNC